MTPYITFRESDNEGNLRYYILQKAFPHFLGAITYLPIDNAIIHSAPISDYNMYVSFSGTIKGNVIPLLNSIDKEAESIMADMAQWYYQNRIMVDEKRFKKWKIKSYGTSGSQ